jgi:hypothetical protein
MEDTKMKNSDINGNPFLNMWVQTKYCSAPMLHSWIRLIDWARSLFDIGRKTKIQGFTGQCGS